MDVLSDVMSLMRTRGHVYGRIELSAPFGLAFPHQYGICLVVTDGGCFLNVSGHGAIWLSAGDFVFLPIAATFNLLSDVNVPVDKFSNAEQLASFSTTRIFEYGGGQGHTVSLIAGCFTFSSPESHLLTDQLPALLHVRVGETATYAQGLMEVMLAEVDNGEPGSSAIIDRLVEILLLQAIRHHFYSADCYSGPGWLRALGDSKIRAALTLIHRNPGAPWTVEKMAREVGMSRSAFAGRFKELVGKTPLDHLTEWRMVHAAGLIRNNPSMKIDTLAESVGYQSESAFRKAFRKVMKITPRTYRQQENIEPHTHEMNSSGQS